MGKQENKISIDLSDNRNVYKNTAQDYIVTTRDKIELVLLKTEKCLTNKNAWMTPLGLIVTCVITLLSSDFKDFILSASVWKAVFILTTIICIIWLVYALYVLIRNWHKGNIDDIIDSIISETKKDGLE